MNINYPNTNTKNLTLKRKLSSSDASASKLRKLNEKRINYKKIPCNLDEDFFELLNKPNILEQDKNNYNPPNQNNIFSSKPNECHVQNAQKCQSYLLNPFQLTKQTVEKRPLETKPEIINEPMNIDDNNSNNNNKNNTDDNIEELYQMQFQLLNQCLNIYISEEKAITDLKNNLTGHGKIMEKYYNKSIMCLRNNENKKNIIDLQKKFKELM